jgi:SAM-dependent methyltransferase
MTYADLTIGDRNRVKRWLQRRRFSDALKVLRRVPPGQRLRVLDFGAGDGELLRQMARVAAIEASAFEPTPELMAEARRRLAHLEGVTFIARLDSVPSGTFDYVFCLEVFEHLPERETVEAISEIHRLLKPDGAAVIGVPHELFVPAMLKGLFRMVRRRGHFDTRAVNILSAVRGRGLERPVTEISPGLPYHLYHLGFDYRRLEQRLQARLRVTEKWFSPFPLFGPALNSEVYFLARPT